ncbi:hypothetical protein LSTR_LSTR008647 [Laodelphax striatellus]|uniref:Uncharacterized protein n=1 Tax=Laodelphax striatellus TaxID=195883 RepID=A0A482WN36_LAOST|nr:hypothetical protein LSTR_LSTR008647 [Laodelphax striatellus]
MKGILRTNKSKHCVTTTPNNKEHKKQIKTKKPSSLPATPSKEKCVTFENYNPPGVDGIIEIILPQDVDRRVGKVPLVPVRRLKSYQFVHREESIQPVERKMKLKRYKRPFTIKSNRNMNEDHLDTTKKNTYDYSKTINKPPNSKSRLTNNLPPMKNRYLDEKNVEKTRNLDEKSVENYLERKIGNGEKKENKKKVGNRIAENSVERKASAKSVEECKPKENEEESGDSEYSDEACKVEAKPSVIMIDIIF